jgi:hypothetical protein
LWCFVALGGTYDVLGASAGFDETKAANNDIFSNPMDFFDLSDYDCEPTRRPQTAPKKAQEEAATLTSLLRQLSLGDMAGYVSCLVTGDNNRSIVPPMDPFRRADPKVQGLIQVLLDVRDRFMEVQRKFLVDEKTSHCQFDLSHMEVVSAWANGCSWSEALEISGAAPGDLTRILGRAMDGLRQIGSLKFHPVRIQDYSTEVWVDPISRGIHPEIRRMCRDAARKMNRYPVKDPLPFEVTVDDMIDEDHDENDALKKRDNIAKDDFSVDLGT